MEMMNEIMKRWDEFVISEREIKTNCLTREIETEKYFEKVKDGRDKPKFRETTQRECDLVYVPPKKVKEETEPLPKRELEKRKKIRRKARP